MGEFDGTTIGGPIQTMREQQDATRSPLLIPLGPFVEANIVASQTANVIQLGDQGTAINSEIVMPHAGYIMGLSFVSLANFTVAPPTLTVQINQVDTTMLVAMATGTLYASVFVTTYGNVLAARFAAGDRIRLVYDTIAGTAPATNDLTAFVWIG